MSDTANKLSFTIRRPSPVSRASSTGVDSDFKVPALPRHLSGTSSGAGSPLGRGSPKPNSRTYEERNSSDEDEVIEDELVTGFDQFGVQRLHEKNKPQGPLVIPALKNKDWREQARKRKQLFVPPSAAAAVATGADGSVGGLGTRDTINSGPQLSGIQMKKRIKVEAEEEEEKMEVEEEVEASTDTNAQPMKQEEETDDQKAIRALIASAKAENGDEDNGPKVDVIPVPTVTEDDAYKQDVAELPESATLEDYERVPVSQFGAALLRGMGWKEGTGASRSGKGPIQPYLPQARPALLGIGAKEKEVFDDGSKKKKKGRPDKRYIPVLKKEKRAGERDGESEYDSAPSGSSSRRRSPERDREYSSRKSSSPEHRRNRDRDRYDSDPDRYRNGRDRDRDRDRDRQRDERVRGERGDKGHDGDRSGRRQDGVDKDYDSGSRRDRDRNRSERRRDR